MAEAVLTMALSGAIKMAASAAASEMSLLGGMQKDIRFIKDELETMQVFLHLTTMKKKDLLFKVWVKRVKDLSYNIEDCLTEFMVHVGSQTLLQRLMKLKDCHRVAMQIRDLKSRVEEVSSRNARYSLIKMEEPNTIGEVDSYVEDVPNDSTSDIDEAELNIYEAKLNIDEAELVGFSKPRMELINLMDVDSRDGIAKVICVVGMGGLGKTTLARKIYESKEDIVKNFSCCAWITVSQKFFEIKMLKDMIMQLLGDEALKQCLRELEEKTVEVDDLATYLRGELEEKRYFIVLDDLWTIEAWKRINDIAFPSSNNKGSRIIATTRDVGLANQITCESLIYFLKPLKPADATNLLLRKTRRTQEDIDTDENLKKLVEQLVKKCGCLPLATHITGGILANKKIAEWRHIYDQLPSELEINPSLEAMRRMVTLGYNYLPSHLKPCFLYLSIFPKGFEIQTRRLVERWIVEGFVKARDWVNIEDVGRSYFNELINRNMILVSRVNVEGSVKSCRVHDIMHDIMVSISRDENFVYLLGANIARVEKENFRHVAYHDRKCQNIEMDWSHVRSLTVFGERPMEPTPSLCSLQLRMLRVLDLHDTQFMVTQKDIKNIGLLLHLRYVNVQGCADIHVLPRSIGKLQGLESLCITDSHITTLPTKISKLKSMRSLRFNNQSKGVRVSKGIRNLKELQILEVVDIRRTSSRAIKVLGELMQLRKLSVTTIGATEQKCKILCAAVEKLSFLCSLCVDATDDNFVGTLDWVHCISSPPPLLRSLKLEGRLGEMPDWVGSLMHLVKIRLSRSELKEGRCMEILGALPNLMLLRLFPNSYVGERLVFRAGAFPHLRKLEIWDLKELRQVRFEEDTSPRVERIQISRCRLELGIVGIKHLPSLLEISLGYNREVAELGVLQGEVDAHPNHPILQLEMDREYHDNVEVEATEETSAAEETSQVVISTTNVSEDDLFYTNVEVEATEETYAAGQRSQVVISTTNVSEDDLFYTYNSC